MKIPYNILIQIKMSVRPYFKGFTLIFFFYNCRKQEYITKRSFRCQFFLKICTFFGRCGYCCGTSTAWIVLARQLCGRSMFPSTKMIAPFLRRSFVRS